MLTARKHCSSRMVVSPTSRTNTLKRLAVVTALLALFCAVSNAGNYRPPDKIENQKPADGLVMDYAQDKQLFRAARGRPAIKRDPAYLTNEKNPDAVAEILSGKRTVANAAWWGFNEKDSTAALQAAIDSGAGKIFIPNMDKDWIVEPLFLNKDDQEIIFEAGVVVMARKGSFKGTNDSLFTAEDKQNITLRGYGATLRMHKKDYHSDAYRKAEWRSGLNFYNSKNITVLGLTIRDTGGDGLYFGGVLCKNVLIRDVVSDNNNRQGMSVISAENFLVENCVFSNTSGTPPMAGIDLEPNNAGQRMVNVRIRNCIFENNSSMGIHVSLGRLNAKSEPVSVLWENNYIRGGGMGIHVGGMDDDGPRGEVTFRNNIIEDADTAGVLVRCKSRKAIRLVFDNLFMKNVAVGKLGAWVHPAAIIFHARSKASLQPGGIEFNNCFVYEPAGGDRVLRNQPVILLTGGFDDMFWTDVSGQVTASVPGGARKRFEMEVKDFTLTLNDESRPFAKAAAKWTNREDKEAVAQVMAGNRTMANAAWWGFDEEDSTAALQAAIDSGVEKLVVPNMGKDWIVEPLFLNSDNQEIFFEPGTVIAAREGSFQSRSASLFQAEDRRNITLRGYGATLKMRKKDYQSPPYQKGEWRSGVNVHNCSNVKVLGLTIRDTGGDGLYFGGTLCKDILIRDVVSDNNHRQGMSIISAENLLVENCVFSNTLGTAPMTGIDLEPNRANQKLANVRIRNCLLENNAIIGMHVYLAKLTSKSADVSVLWESNVVRGGDVGIHVTAIGGDTPKGLIEFRNNIVEDTRHTAVMIRQKEAATALRLEFNNGLFRNTTTLAPYDMETVNLFRHYWGIQYPSQWWRHATHWWRNFPVAPIVFRVDGTEWMGGIAFNNCFVIENKDVPVLVAAGSGNPAGDNMPGWSDITGSITAANPFGARVEFRRPVKNFTVKVNGKSVQPDAVIGDMKTE